MPVNKNILFYLIAAFLFIAFKLGYKTAGNDELYFLLKPTDVCFSLLSGSASTYSSASGFFHESLHITITKACSGFNFWMLCFILFIVIAVPYIKSIRGKILLFPTMLIMGYLLTIFANTARIQIAVIIQRITKAASLTEYEWLHQAEGAFVYFFFLVLFYFVLNSLCIKLNHQKYA